MSAGTLKGSAGREMAGRATDRTGARARRTSSTCPTAAGRATGRPQSRTPRRRPLRGGRPWGVECGLGTGREGGREGEAGQGAKSSSSSGRHIACRSRRRRELERAQGRQPTRTSCISPASQPASTRCRDRRLPRRLARYPTGRPGQLVSSWCGPAGLPICGSPDGARGRGSGENVRAREKGPIRFRLAPARASEQSAQTSPLSARPPPSDPTLPPASNQPSSLPSIDTDTAAHLSSDTLSKQHCIQTSFRFQPAPSNSRLSHPRPSLPPSLRSAAWRPRTATKASTIRASLVPLPLSSRPRRPWLTRPPLSPALHASPSAALPRNSTSSLRGQDELAASQLVSSHPDAYAGGASRAGSSLQQGASPHATSGVKRRGDDGLDDR